MAHPRTSPSCNLPGIPVKGNLTPNSRPRANPPPTILAPHLGTENSGRGPVDLLATEEMKSCRRTEKHCSTRTIIKNFLSLRTPALPAAPKRAYDSSKTKPGPPPSPHAKQAPQGLIYSGKCQLALKGTPETFQIFCEPKFLKPRNQSPPPECLSGPNASSP